MELRSGREQTPQMPLYALSEAYFSQPPSAILDYHFGDKITRENFLTFLILSYAMSRGDQRVHRIFMMWMQQINGFDYETTLRSFVTKGGWKALSKEEQARFLKAFKDSGVKKHDPFIEASDELGIDEIGIISEEFTYLDFEKQEKTTITKVEPVRKEFFDFSQTHSLGDFSRSTDKYLAYKRNTLYSL